MFTNIALLVLTAQNFTGSPVEYIRAQVSVPELRLLKLEQRLQSTFYTVTLSLLTPRGRRLARIIRDGESVVEMETIQTKGGPALVFLRKQGNHASAEVIRVTAKALQTVWGATSAGGIVYEDFGAFSEILVGRIGPQVGLNSREPKLGHFFQEVYAVRQGQVRFLGVRRQRSDATRTRKSELIPDASPESVGPRQRLVAK